MTFEPASQGRDHTAPLLVRALRKRCAVFVSAAAMSLLAACEVSPPDPVAVAQQSVKSAECKRQPADCPWAMSSGKNNSCIDSGLGGHRRWRCWKGVAH
jgi:hypothetical protein